MTNVIPLNDDADHIEDTYCWCQPRVEYRDPETGEEYPNGALIVHNSEDGRETVEQLLGEKLAPDKTWVTIYQAE